jgi:hypothetical protein
MIIHIIIWLIEVYLLCGIVFAVPFLITGLSVIDENAAGSKFGFRLIILPGTIVFWPFLLRKWLVATKEPSND